MEHLELRVRGDSSVFRRSIQALWVCPNKDRPEPGVSVILDRKFPDGTQVAGLGFAVKKRQFFGLVLILEGGDIKLCLSSPRINALGPGMDYYTPKCSASESFSGASA
jgi:hypothetical protein